MKAWNWGLAAGLVVLAALTQLVNRPVEGGAWAHELKNLPLIGETLREVPLEGDALSILGVDAYRFVEDRPEGIPVWMYAGYYAGQRANAQIHSPEHCYPGSGYAVEESRVAQESDHDVRELVVKRGESTRLVWFAYRTRVGWTTNSFGLKRDQIVAAILARSRDALLLRVSTPVYPGEGLEAARTRVANAWSGSTAPVRAWYVSEGSS